MICHVNCTLLHRQCSKPLKSQYCSIGSIFHGENDFPLAIRPILEHHRLQWLISFFETHVLSDRVRRGGTDALTAHLLRDIHSHRAHLLRNAPSCIVWPDVRNLHFHKVIYIRRNERPDVLLHMIQKFENAPRLKAKVLNKNDKKTTKLESYILVSRNCIVLKLVELCRNESIQSMRPSLNFDDVLLGF